MPETPQTRSVILVDTSEAAAARSLAADHGVDVEEVPRFGIEPVTTVTLVLIGSAAAVGAVLHILEQRKGGQVVDLRPGAPKAFYRTPDVVYGTVVVMDRAVALLETGDEQARQLGSHPPAELRMRRMRELLTRDIGAHPANTEAAQRALGTSEVQAEIIRLLWERTRPVLMDLRRQGVRAARTWRTIPKETGG